uniref:START domain-containing protein n=3 Tax=Globisporangium ultimum (strain ATCC 200006 / CBS 805.95 / DAOM BR144) TaxID=431595 RepID=K3WWR0_GLOUD
MFGLKSLQILALVAAMTAPAVFADVDTNATAAEPVFGELLVNKLTAYPIANRMFAEAETIWSSKGWYVISNSSGILNEGKPVSGVFAPASVDITRATGVVNAPAQKLFDYLITPIGYQLIDPASNPDDYYKPPLESYNTFLWRGFGHTDKKRLEAARVEANIPGVKLREFVVLNAIDANTRLFVSKSVQHKGDPGCSIYGPASCNAISTDPVRALNTFAVQVEPLAGDANKCVVQLINYADYIAPEISAAVMKVLTTDYLPQMLGRMQAAFASS